MAPVQSAPVEKEPFPRSPLGLKMTTPWPTMLWTLGLVSHSVLGVQLSMDVLAVFGWKVNPVLGLVTASPQ